MTKQYKYTGKLQPIQEDPKTGEIIYPYIPDEALIKAVNLSIHLKRPLLLEGQPGGGKTELARAVARELDLPYKEFSVKSTSKATDLIYSYDTIGRLRDTQLIAIVDPVEARKLIERSQKKDKGEDKEENKYIIYGALGEAFNEKTKRTVVLIDEIDKADIDFPNDLLQELDKKEFYIKEIQEKVPADKNNPPIIFITSNAERQLPNAFLRRCLYYYVKFPNKEQLLKIIDTRFPKDKKQLSSELIDKVLDRFIELHTDMNDNQEERESTKTVGTSELIDWVEAMREASDKQEIWRKIENGEILFPETLLKSQKDRERYLDKDSNDEEKEE